MGHLWSDTGPVLDIECNKEPDDEYRSRDKRLKNVAGLLNCHFVAFKLIRKNVLFSRLPQEVQSLIVRLFPVFHVCSIIEDAIKHGWSLSTTQHQIDPPQKFECVGWGAIYKNTIYEGKTLYMPCFIFETSVRRTGKRHDGYY